VISTLPGWGGEFQLEVSSLSSRIHMVVPGMEKFKGKEVTFVSGWVTSQGLLKLCSIFEGMFKN